MSARGLRGPTEFTVRVPPKRSLEHTLAAIGYGDQLVDLRGAEQEPALAEWAGRRQRMRSFGSVALPLSGNQLATIVPARDFDGIALVHRTTRARPIRT